MHLSPQRHLTAFRDVTFPTVLERKAVPRRPKAHGKHARTGVAPNCLPSMERSVQGHMQSSETERPQNISVGSSPVILQSSSTQVSSYPYVKLIFSHALKRYTFQAPSVRLSILCNRHSTIKAQKSTRAKKVWRKKVKN